MADKEPKEREKYMEESRETMEHPPDHKEGLQEPRVTGYNKVKVGIVIFVVLVLIIFILGMVFDLFGVAN